MIETVGGGEKEITEQVVIMVNLLMGLGKNNSDYFINVCHREAELLQKEIFPDEATD